jgi:hypothetical protein
MRSFCHAAESRLQQRLLFHRVNLELTPIAVGDWLVHAASLRSANNFLQTPTTFHGYSPQR